MARPSGLRALFQREGLAGWRLPLLVAALVLGLGGRIVYSFGTPFWFDETFTAVIAGQPTLAKLIDWCLHELTGPAFYGPFWVWEKIAGSSNLALRLPNLVLSIATPLAVLRFGHRDADLRLWWAVFLLLWVPIFTVAGEARAYPEIFALGVAQAALFVRLLERPTIRHASLWITVSSLSVLCNYWGAFPALVQGLAFLAVHRLRAVRTWPALVFLLPMLAWSAYHLPIVMAFAMGDSSGIDGLPASELLEIPAFILGIGLNATLVFALVAGSTMIEFARKDKGRQPRLTPETILALCAIAAVAAILVLAFVRPGFAPRYLTATMPSFLFGLALWARWMTRRNAKAVMLVVAILLTTAAGVIVLILRDPQSDDRHIFELERPSAWLAEGQAPEHLVIFWDGSVGARSDADRLAEIGGFFLRRSGHPVVVSVARAAPDKDANRAVLAMTDPRRKSAILWFANEKLPVDRVPRIERYDPRYECRNFGRDVVIMTACRWRR